VIRLFLSKETFLEIELVSKKKIYYGMSKIKVKGIDITIISKNDNDYISLTDMVRNHENNNVIISNWLRQKNTLEFLSIWEKINNPDFKLIEFDELIKDAGLNRFAISPKKWSETTGAIGIVSKSGKFGGTYAHKDIAFHFGLWVSPEFNLLLIKEFQRLKDEESKSLNGVWDYRRFLTKSNYRIQTDAVKEVLIPLKKLPKEKEGFVYAEEADLLYVAMFGYTSSTWRKNNSELALQGYNLRDVADTYQLIVLNNLEVLNAELIRSGSDANTRLAILRKSAIQQLKSLQGSKNIEDTYLESPNKKKTLQKNEDTNRIDKI